MLDSVIPANDPRAAAQTSASGNKAFPRTFVGIGFGPIQAGLFLYEAFVSGNFSRLVATEIQPDVVAAVRAAGGMYTLNIAHPDHVETVAAGPVDLYNTGEADDRAHLIDAIAHASEIATALPSVNAFVGHAPGSVDKMLAQGLLRKLEIGGPPVLIYTGENNIRAAEHLREALANALPDTQRAQALAQASIVNTVIGKMSGTTPATEAIQPITPGFPRAFLVEA